MPVIKHAQRIQDIIVDFSSIVQNSFANDLCTMHVAARSYSRSHRRRTSYKVGIIWIRAEKELQLECFYTASIENPFSGCGNLVFSRLLRHMKNEKNSNEFNWLTMLFMCLYMCLCTLYISHIYVWYRHMQFWPEKPLTDIFKYFNCQNQPMTSMVVMWTSTILSLKKTKPKKKGVRNKQHIKHYVAKCLQLFGWKISTFRCNQ